jgi:hypothetical protein
MRRFFLTVCLLLAPAGLAGQSIDGRVIDPTGSPVPDAEVALVDSTGAVMARAVTGLAGTFRLEGVPPGDHRIRVTALDRMGTTEETVPPGTGSALTVTIQPSADARSLAVALDGDAVTQFITGTVLDAQTEDPIEAMDVILRDVRGERVGRTLSSKVGRFAFRVGDPGLYRVAVSRLGYDSTATAELGVPPGQNLYVEVRVQPAALGLEPIRVTAPPTLPYLESTGFYERQRRGLGSFLGPDELARVPTAFPTHVLRRIAGISVTRGQIRIRGVNSLMGGGPCTPTIILDHMRVRGARLDDIVPMSQVEAIEVYKGPATVPPQWRDAATCGVIAVWTKH